MEINWLKNECHPCAVARRHHLAISLEKVAVSDVDRGESADVAPPVWLPRIVSRDFSCAYTATQRDGQINCFRSVVMSLPPTGSLKRATEVSRSALPVASAIRLRSRLGLKLS